MGKVLAVNNIVFGEGIPKICIPLIGQTEKDIILQAKQAAETDCDVVEWRADFYSDALDYLSLIDTLKKLRNILSDRLLLFTLRTRQDGGMWALGEREYESVNRLAISSGYVNLIDIELSAGTKIISSLLMLAKGAGVYSLVSSHDFQGTPASDQILNHLNQMQQTGSDLVKIAVTPKSRDDVLKLLSATLEYSSQPSAVPSITMSMGDIGRISRLTGEFFGSAMTFASLGERSAPGQIPYCELIGLLKAFHTNCQ